MRFGRARGLWGTLRFRLTAWNAAVVLLVAVLALVGVREGVRRTLMEEVDELLLEDALEIRLALHEADVDSVPLRDALNHKAQGHVHHRWFVQLYDGAGQLQWASDNAPPLSAPKGDAGGNELKSAPPFRIVESRVAEAGRAATTIRVGSSLEYVDQAVAHLTRFMALAAGAVLIVAPLGGYWLAGRATQPLARIIATAAKLQPSHLDERLPVRGAGDELDQLSDTINGMLDRIAAYLGQHRSFIANAAHELRSPLAAVCSTVDVALTSARSSEEYAAVLGDVLEECSALGNLVNRLMVLAEGDADRIEAGQQRTRLDRVVARSLEMFQGVAEGKQVELRAGALAEATVPGEEHYLRQIVQNLVENAVKFTPAGGEVVAEVTRDPALRQAVLRVRDTGIGIRPDDLPHVFERFYSGDKSRHHENGKRSYGLGLSICQTIVTALGGDMTVESKPGAGTEFTVRLPEAGAESA